MWLLWSDSSDSRYKCVCSGALLCGECDHLSVRMPDPEIQLKRQTCDLLVTFSSFWLPPLGHPRRFSRATCIYAELLRVTFSSVGFFPLDLLGDSRGRQASMQHYLESPSRQLASSLWTSLEILECDRHLCSII